MYKIKVKKCLIIWQLEKEIDGKSWDSCYNQLKKGLNKKLVNFV